MTKEVLSQYSDLQEEIKEVRKKIAKLQDDLEKIESGESVIDTVSGGMGGTQHFKIEGVPYPEYGRKRTLLYSRMTCTIFINIQNDNLPWIHLCQLSAKF